MISERIREIRNKKEFNQDDVAAMLNVSKQTYYKWEKGETEPKASQIQKLAKCLGVTIQDFFSEEKNSIDQETRCKIIETEKLSDDEKKCLNMFIEAIMIRHYSKAASSKLGL
jgi:transcriptional regulator with XRE-family HTH domain